MERRRRALVRLFPANRQPNNPAPSNSVQRLKFIGPEFASRLSRRNLHTLQQLATYMSRRTRAQNRTFLNSIFRNPRQQHCLPPSRRRARPCPCNYHVRPINRMGYNAIVYYMVRRSLVPLARLPTASQVQRPRSSLRAAYPNRCGTRARR